MIHRDRAILAEGGPWEWDAEDGVSAPPNLAGYVRCADGFMVGRLVERGCGSIAGS